MEATGGFEPPNRGFANLRLNHLATSPALPFYGKTAPDAIYVPQLDAPSVRYASLICPFLVIVVRKILESAILTRAYGGVIHRARAGFRRRLLQRNTPFP
jgi:hypothetical protein